jgi:hypothetical protein
LLHCFCNVHIVNTYSVKKHLLRYFFPLAIICCLFGQKLSAQTYTINSITGGLTAGPYSGYQTGLACYGFTVSPSSATTIQGFNIKSGSGTALNTIIGNAKLYRATTTDYTTAALVQVGTAVVNSGEVSITGLSEGFSAGQTKNYFLVVDDIYDGSSNFQPAFIYGQTPAAVTSSTGSASTFTSGGSYGTYVNLQAGTTPVATNLTGGINSSSILTYGQTGLALFGFSLNVTGGRTFNAFHINSGNALLSSYFSNFKLYHNTTSTYGTGTATLVGTATINGSYVDVTGLTEAFTNNAGQTNNYFLVGDYSNNAGAVPATIQFNFASGQSTAAMNQSSPITTTYNAFTVTGNSFSLNTASLAMTSEQNGLSSATVYAGETSVAVFGFGLSSTSGTSTITQMNINSDNGSLSTYYGNAKLYSCTTNNYSTGTTTLLGSGTISGSFVNFTGLNQTINGTAKYYFLVVDVTYSGAGTNSTIFKFVNGQGSNALVQSTPTSSYNTFNITGNTYSIAQPTIAMTNTGIGGLASSNLFYGSTYAVMGFSIQVTGIATISTINLQSNNSNLSTYFTGRLYRNTTATYGSGTATQIGTVAFSGSNTSITGLTETISNTTNYYFLVVDDIYYTSASPQVQFNIGYAQGNSAIVTSTGSTFNTYSFNTATYTLKVPSPTVTITGNNSTANGLTAGTLSYGQTGMVLFSFKASVLGVMTISQFDIPTYVNGSLAGTSNYFGNGKVYRSTTQYFSDAVQVTGSVAFNNPTVISGMSESFTTYASPTVYYYFLVADFSGNGLSSPSTLQYNFVNGSTSVTSNSPTFQTFNTNSTSDGILFNMGATYHWNGTTSTDFTDKNNWRTQNNSTPASAPSSTDIVEIGVVAYGGLFQPNIPGTVTVGGITFGSNNIPMLSFSSGASLTLTKSLIINSGATIISLVPLGSASLNIGPLARVTFGATTGCSFSIPSALTFTLKSDATGTAGIGPMGSGSITGTGATAIKAERYIPAGNRGYRLLSSPLSNVTSATPYTASLPSYDLNYMKLKTIISGPSDASNGFTASTLHNPSVFAYNETLTTPTTNNISTSDYKGFASTAQYLSMGNGILLFYRGNENTTKTGGSGNAFTSPYPTPETTTLTHVGSIVTGNVVVNRPVFAATSTYYYVTGTPVGTPGVKITGSSTNLSYTVTTLPGTDGFNLLGNPYPSTIDFEALVSGTDFSNLSGGSLCTFYTLNPTNTNGYGTYTRSGNNTNGTALNGGSRYLLSGEGFFVKAASASATFRFTEASKTTYPTGGAGTVSGTPTVFSLKEPLASMKIKLTQDATYYNETLVTFNKQNKNDYTEDEDVAYLAAPGQQVFMYTVSTDGAACIINRMQPLEEIKTVKLYAEGAVTGAYKMDFANTNIDSRYHIFLKDSFTKDSVDVTANTTYNFNIDRGNTATYGANRFTLVVYKDNTGDYQFLTFTGTKQQSVAKLTWTVKNEGDVTTFYVERSTDGGKTFPILSTIQSSNAGTYNFTDNKPFGGDNIYRIRQDDVNDKVTFSNKVTLTFDASLAVGGAITLYPNPTATKFSVDFAQNIINPIEVRVVSLMGKTMKTTTFSATQHIEQDVSSLLAGIYIIDVYDSVSNKKITSTKFIKN